MNYITTLNEARKQIISCCPQFENSSFIEDNTGWTNYVVKIDNQYIFRFPRNYESYKNLQNENIVLSYLSKLLPDNIKIPQFIYKNMEDNVFVGYKMIKGNFISKNLYDNMTALERERFIKNITTFLNILHSIDTNTLNLNTENSVSDFKKRYEEIKKICFKYLDETEKIATTKLFEKYLTEKNMTNYKKVLVHGDLSEDHIIITDDGIGIIDFGDTSVFDGAYDLTFALIYDEKLYDDILKGYIRKC